MRAIPQPGAVRTFTELCHIPGVRFRFRSDGVAEAYMRLAVSWIHVYDIVRLFDPPDERFSSYTL